MHFEYRMTNKVLSQLRRVMMVCITLLVLCPIAWAAIDRTYIDRTYQQWSTLPSKQLVDMGIDFRKNQQRIDSAFLCFSIAANRYYDKHLNDADRRESVRAFQMMGRTYFFDYEDFIKADSIISLAEELAHQHHYDDLLPDILIDQSSIVKALNKVVHGTQRIDTVSLNMLKTAFHLAYKKGNWQSAKVSFFNLMLDCINVNEDQYVGGIMDSVLRVMPESVSWQPMAVQLIDNVRAFNNGDLNGALTHLQAFKASIPKYTNYNEQPSALMIANTYLHTCLMNMGRYEAARDCLEENISIATSNHQSFHLSDAYGNLANYYHFLGDSVQAEKYRLKFLECREEIINKKRLGNVAQQQFLRAMEKKNREVAQLAQQRQARERIILWVSIAAILLLVIVGFLIWRNRKIAHRNRKLYERMQQLLEQDKKLLHELQQQAESVPPVDPDSSGHAEKTHSSSPLDDTEKSELLHRIFIVMETCDEVFQEGFTLDRLAELAQGNRNYASQVINERYGMHFNALLAEYRVKEVCRRMSDKEKNGNLTLEALGRSVGFKSNSNFIKTFKRVTGLTPSAYLRQNNTSC